MVELRELEEEYLIAAWETVGEQLGVPFDISAVGAKLSLRAFATLV